MDGISTDVGLKGSLHAQDDLNESSRMDGTSTDVVLKANPPSTLHEQDDLNEESWRLDGGSTDVGLKQIPPLSLHKQDDLNEDSSRVVDLSNGTPLRARQKPTSNFVALGGGLESINNEGHTIASRSNINGDSKDIVDGHESWKTTGGLTIAEKSTKWYKALLVNDCKSLMEQLHEDDSLVVQTGHNGRTVLLAAARRGCTQLVDQVMKIFKDSEDQFITMKNCTKILQSPLHDLFQAEDFKTKLWAAEIMQLFMGNDVILRHMKVFYGKKLARFCPPSVGAYVSASGNDEHIDVHVLKKIREITNKLSNTENFKALMGQHSQDKDYNFDKKCTEFIFHYACQSMSKAEKHEDQILSGSAEDFVWSFIKELGGDKGQKILQGSDGDKILQSLYKIKNWQGKTPCHAALSGSTSGFEKLLGLLRDTNDPTTIKLFLNACDARGWTPLHKVVAMVSEHDYLKSQVFISLLLKNEEVKVNEKLPESQATPLHLAILHNLPRVVVSLIQSSQNIEGVLNDSLRRKIRFSSTTQSRRWSSSRWLSSWWSPLQLATIMGHHGVVEALITKIDMIYEVSKRKNKGVAPIPYNDKIPSIHLAAASGVPEVLKLFLDKKPKIFDPSKTTAHKRTTLHFAVDTTAPYMVDKPTFKANNFMNPFQCILDFGDVQHLEYIITKASKKKLVVGDHVDKDNSKVVTQKNFKPQMTTLEEYGGKQACITMLLQNGVDIWQQDDQWKFAEPGAETSYKIRTWWFQKIAEEKSATKKTLNDAANAISVVAALIASASYGGPLQPPLGFGTVSTSSYFDFVQTSSIPVKIFVISNCLSFYLAIGSIMFAIVPSVPMPKQGTGFDEWQRSKRTVGAALSLLLFSVFCVVVSFAAASNAGMSDHDSYKHGGLAFIPAMIGGIPCLIGIIVFFRGYLRFIFGIKNDIKRFINKTEKIPLQNIYDW